MFKQKSALVILILLALFGISVVSIKALSLQIQPTPRGPVNQERAIQIALGAAQAWNEPNAQLLTGRKLSRGESLDQLKAQGEEVFIAGTGEMWIVTLRGNFTPNRVRLGAVVHCTEMSVAVAVENGDVLSITCR
ncbi:MAG: hypothetical protein HY867_10265 [Chloroflexi bacterium]|nr:hypothetical protein [Chloroflexota bacterium]